MNHTDTIFEAEAATLAGVSPLTLVRFAEAGYFKVENTANGRCFSRRELEGVFGVPTDLAPSLPVSSATPFEMAPPSCSLPRHEEEYPPSSYSTNTSISKSDEIFTASPSIDVVKSSSSAEIEATISTPSPSSLPSSVSGLAQDNGGFQREIHRLQTVLSLHEKLLEAREAEIRELKDERSWLRTRIERLDEKSDRDQILLLSETQTIRRLITHQNEPRKGPVRAALEWLGVVEPTPSSNNSQAMIDVTPRP